jgi:uncharacterized phage protein gp47/JayE
MGTISDINSQLVVYTRDQERDRYTRSYKIRQPAADVSDGTQPFLDASVHADTGQVLYNDASTVADATNISDARGARLDLWGVALGRARAPASGSRGFVVVTTASGGGLIQQGDEIKEPNSGLRLKCSATAVYTNGQEVPVESIDTGTQTNFAAGTVLQWTAPRPGIGPNAVVFAESDGSGLSGGHPEESDDEYAAALIELRANPPASGNDAEYQHTVENIPGLAVEKCWTYPAINGPGTAAFVFTMRTSAVGDSRVPNAAQIATALAALTAKEPGDDGIFGATLTESPVAVVYKIDWNDSASDWTDTTTWPPYDASSPVHVTNAVTPTATTFRLTSTSSLATPVVGNTIAFYNAKGKTFVRKRIGAVTVVSANHTWDITCSTSNAVSDTSYVPVNLQIASPWSDSLPTIVMPTLTYFSKLGPGEQVSPLPDPGLRQRRQPEAPAQWPSALTNRIVEGLFNTNSVLDAQLALPVVPHDAPTGTPGVLSYLLSVGDVAAYPE